VNIFNFLIFISALIGGVVAAVMVEPYWGPIIVTVGFYLSFSPRLVREWERGILLRLGKFHAVLQPGLHFVVPGIDSVAARVDMRIRSTTFSAERTLTKDTVPVNVDAVLFWTVTDAKTAVLEVERFLETITWAAQSTLRDVIGRTELVRMISDREKLDSELQETIDAKASEWGVAVASVEIRDMIIPGALEDAMSRKAQADREKEARIILADSELTVAEKMREAAKTYREDPEAMRLRAMNMTYESIKESGALMVIPSGMTGAFDPGVVGLATSAFRLEGTKPKD